MSKYSSKNKELFRLFSLLESEKEARDLLEDLLAPKEIDVISERWAVMQEVQKGLSQREIARKFNISIAKVSRCARVVQHGCGAVKLFIDRIAHSQKK